MNTRMIGFLLGRILMVEAGLLALPLLTALLYGEPLMPWLATMLVLAAIGGALSLRKPERTALYAKDGFAAVALVWLLMSAFGALPFVLSGDIPNYIDAFFEKEGNLYTTSELFSEEEIDDFFDCGVEDIENIIDICKAYDVKCPHEFRLTYNVISKSFDSNYNYDNVTEVLDKDVLELVEDWFKSVTKTLLNDRR